MAGLEPAISLSWHQIAVEGDGGSMPVMTVEPRRHYHQGTPDGDIVHAATPCCDPRSGGMSAARDRDTATLAGAHGIADAFGLFGSPERCAERLMQAHDEAGVDDVFLFPHDLAGGYLMPEAEVDAFQRVIRPRLGD